MSVQAEIKEGAIVEIPNKGKLKIYSCKSCQKLMALENAETDRTKPARWVKWNLDGSRHEDAKASGSGNRTYTPKKQSFWVGLSQEVETSAVKDLKRTWSFKQEFIVGETDPQTAFDYVEAQIIHKLGRDAGSAVTHTVEPDSKKPPAKTKVAESKVVATLDS